MSIQVGESANYLFLQDIGVPIQHSMARLCAVYYAKFQQPPGTVCVARAAHADIDQLFRQHGITVAVISDKAIVPPDAGFFLEPDLGANARPSKEFAAFVAQANTLVRQAPKHQTPKAVRSSPMAAIIENGNADSLPVPVAPVAVKPAPVARISFAQIVERGMVPLGSKLYHEKRTAATVQAGGQLLVGDFAGSIHEVGAHLAKTKSCNGWVTWYVQQGKDWVVLDTLRQQVVAAA